MKSCVGDFSNIWLGPGGHALRLALCLQGWPLVLLLHLPEERRVLVFVNIYIIVSSLALLEKQKIVQHALQNSVLYRLMTVPESLISMKMVSIL